MRVCDVYIEERFLQNRTLSYRCDGFVVAKGMRVLINMNGRMMIGFVNRVYEAKTSDFEFELKLINGVLDEDSIINKELFELAQYMSHQTVSPLISCLQTILPNKLKPRSSSQTPKMETILKFKEDTGVELTKKQQAFLDKFKSYDEITLKEARSFYNDYMKLVEYGYFERITREVRYTSKYINQELPTYELTQTQKVVIDTVKFNNSRTYLLHGVTGSGKTEVYLTLAEKALKNKQQVLFLVPEISLTPQMIDRVSKRFGKDVVIYHSGLNDQEKYEQYLRIKNHEMHLVVGTRSSVFLPFDNLGLIVMDEEHDSSYKQDNVPAYHTLDIAQFRSQYHNCPLVLGSASPSLDSYARALKGVYTLMELPSRINNSFPEVVLVNTETELRKGHSSVLTEVLKEKIHDRLNKKEQIILLLNRRGYMTFLKDKETGQVLMCPNCDVSLNFHKESNLLKCHICDYQTRCIPKGSDGKELGIVGSGVGTQRLVEGLQQMFPTANIVRMDRDTTSTKNSHKNLLETFSSGKGDILVGTQMIAKGLDNANVTLVGVVNIDAALMHEDYRSVENTFSLILQATGRSGRGDKPGEVVIQTFNPNHYAIVYGSQNQYKRFFNQEMQYRKIAQYPPYSHLISLTFIGDEEHKVSKQAQTFLSVLDNKDMSIMGPAKLRKLNRLERSRIILKGKDLEKMLESVHAASELYYKLEKGGLRVDVNPLTLI